MLEQSEDDAPKRARSDDREGEMAVVGRSVTINRPRVTLFAFWRDFQNLPRFMEAIEKIEPTGPQRSRWTIRAPAGQMVTFEAEVTDVKDNERIAWRALPGSQIMTEGTVSFSDAPAGRGTIVTANIKYQPPGGDLGRLVAKLFMAEPNIQARHELKRFKMLMEAGEIATADNRKSKEDR